MLDTSGKILSDCDLIRFNELIEDHNYFVVWDVDKFDMRHYWNLQIRCNYSKQALNDLDWTIVGNLYESIKSYIVLHEYSRGNLDINQILKAYK